MDLRAACRGGDRADAGDRATAREGLGRSEDLRRLDASGAPAYVAGRSPAERGSPNAYDLSGRCAAGLHRGRERTWDSGRHDLEPQVLEYRSAHRAGVNGKERDAALAGCTRAVADERFVDPTPAVGSERGSAPQIGEVAIRVESDPRGRHRP